MCLLEFWRNYLGKIRKWNAALGNLSLITTTEEVENTTRSGFFISVLRPVVQLGLTFGWGGTVLCLLSDDLSIFSGIFEPWVLVQLPIRMNLEHGDDWLIETLGTFVNLYCPSSNSTHCPILSIQDCLLRSNWSHLWGRYLPLLCCFTWPATLLALAPCWQTYHQKVKFSEWQMWSPQPTWTTPW